MITVEIDQSDLDELIEYLGTAIDNEQNALEELLRQARIHHPHVDRTATEETLRYLKTTQRRILSALKRASRG